MSFKLRLVAYFLLVSLLPLGAAGWALHSVTSRSETRRVDVRLEGGLHAGLAAYTTALTDAARLAAPGGALPRQASRTETRRVPVRLEAALHAVLASYRTELTAPGDRAAR